MIRVTVELLPGGDESRARHLGTAEIANDGTGTAEEGNYTVTLSKWGRPKQVWERGAFTGFDRKRLGPWDLLLCALIACGIDQRLIANRRAPSTSPARPARRAATPMAKP